MAGAIAQGRQRCQFSCLVDEKPTFVPGGSARERSGGARKVACGTARSKSERAEPLACVGRRLTHLPARLHALREWRATYCRSTLSIRACQPSPVDLK